MTTVIKLSCGVGLMAAAAMALSGCEKPKVKAPRDPGVCYQVGFPESGRD